MERNVPEYVSRSVPVPLAGRVPWYKSTFPSYFGIFLFVGFYLRLAGPTLGFTNVSVSLWGLVVAGPVSYTHLDVYKRQAGWGTRTPFTTPRISRWNS